MNDETKRKFFNIISIYKGGIMSSKFIFAFLGTTLLSTTALAGLPEAISAYETKQYPQAIEEFQYLADEGDATAMFYLAQMYSNGQGVEKDEKKALELLQKADAAGNEQAATELAKRLMNDPSVESNPEAAIEYLKKAAYNGDVDALYELGELYAKGENGVQKEFTYAFGYYLMGALKGDKRAQHKLAFCYLKGRGTTQDFENGIKWLARSANQGYVLAQKDLADLQSTDPRLTNIPDAYAWYSIIAAYNTDEIGTEAAKRREEIAAKLGKKDVLIARQRAARDWRPITPEQSVTQEDLLTIPTPIIPGFNDAETTQKRLTAGSVMLTDGAKFGITPSMIAQAEASGDYSAMTKIIEEAGKNGNVLAYAYYGDLMQSRFKNDAEAFKWYQKGADNKENYARYQLATFYCEGRGVEHPSVVECYKWLTIANQTTDPALKTTIAQSMATLESQATPEELDAGKKAAEAYKKEALSKKSKTSSDTGGFNFF